MGLAKIAEELRARRLAALERVADFLFAGQDAALLRFLLREWLTSSRLTTRRARWILDAPLWVTLGDFI